MSSASSPSITSFWKSSLKTSRTILMRRSGSLCRRAGACWVSTAWSISAHWLVRRWTSSVNCSSVAPSAAVRTITPASSGSTSLRIFLRRARSVSGSLRLMPFIDPLGTYTRYRPGRLTWLVSRAPLCPTGSLVTCTSTRSPGWRASSIFRAWFLPSRPSLSAADAAASQSTSPAYNTALRPRPMSTKAASMLGSTFCTRPR